MPDEGRSSSFEYARALYSKECDRLDLSDEDLGMLAVIHAGNQQANIGWRGSFRAWLEKLDVDDVRRMLFRDPTVIRA
jgi:hypothetical protein